MDERLNRCKYYNICDFARDCPSDGITAGTWYYPGKGNSEIIYTDCTVYDLLKEERIDNKNQAPTRREQ